MFYYDFFLRLSPASSAILHGAFTWFFLEQLDLYDVLFSLAFRLEVSVFALSGMVEVFFPIFFPCPRDDVAPWISASLDPLIVQAFFPALLFFVWWNPSFFFHGTAPAALWSCRTTVSMI